MLDISEQLVLSAIKGDLQAFMMLISQAADLNFVFKDSTALGWAAHNGNIEMVKALLKRGANTDIQDSLGNTPLHWALFNNHLEVAKLLIKHGANQNTLNKNGLTPSQFAATRQQLKTA